MALFRRSRKNVWVAGHDRDGVYVRGHWRAKPRPERSQRHFLTRAATHHAQETRSYA